MNICHCLFWIKDNKISAVLCQNEKLCLMKFGGNMSVEYTADFWENWRDYSGFLKTSLTDFCFVYDELPYISEYFNGKECPSDKCVWNRYKIQSVADMLDILQPTQIFNEKGVRVAQTGSFRNIEESDIVRLTAAYRTTENEVTASDDEPVEITPFIEECLKKLQIYDKE